MEPKVIITIVLIAFIIGGIILFFFCFECVLIDLLQHIVSCVPHLLLSILVWYALSQENRSVVMAKSMEVIREAYLLCGPSIRAIQSYDATINNISFRWFRLCR